MRPVLLALGLLVAAPARADVIVVDPQGADGSAVLKAALQAAQPGDILLLKAPSYLGAEPRLLVDTPDLTLVAEPALGRVLIPPLLVKDLVDGGTLLLRGVDATTTAEDFDGENFGALRFVDSPRTTVWAENSRFAGHTEPTGLGMPAIAAGAASLALVRCTVLGGAGADGDAPSGDVAVRLGIGATMVETLVLDSELHGGDSGPGLDSLPIVTTQGGDGLIANGDVFVAGSLVTGGTEGADNDSHPGQGGDGIAVIGFGAEVLVHVRDSTLLGGPVQGLGQPGVPSSVPPLAYGEYASAWRSLELPGLVREHQPAALLATGQPGDVVFVLAGSSVLLGKALNGPEGALIFDLKQLPAPLALGTIPAGGSLALSFTLPDLPPGLDGLRLFVQGIFLGAEGATLGGASAMAWISDAF
jgi:hypothetical protein